MYPKTLPSTTEDIRKARKPYRKSKLTVLGDLRSLTLGSSFGTGESNNPLTRKPKVSAPVNQKPGSQPPGQSGFIKPPDNPFLP